MKPSPDSACTRIFFFFIVAAAAAARGRFRAGAPILGNYIRSSRPGWRKRGKYDKQTSRGGRKKMKRGGTKRRLLSSATIERAEEESFLFRGSALGEGWTITVSLLTKAQGAKKFSPDIWSRALARLFNAPFLYVQKKPVWPMLWRASLGPTWQICSTKSFCHQGWMSRYFPLTNPT